MFVTYEDLLMKTQISFVDAMRVVDIVADGIQATHGWPARVDFFETGMCGMQVEAWTGMMRITLTPRANTAKIQRMFIDAFYKYRLNPEWHSIVTTLSKLQEYCDINSCIDITKEMALAIIKEYYEHDTPENVLQHLAERDVFAFADDYDGILRMFVNPRGLAQCRRNYFRLVGKELEVEENLLRVDQPLDPVAMSFMWNPPPNMAGIARMHQEAVDEMNTEDIRSDDKTGSEFHAEGPHTAQWARENNGLKPQAETKPYTAPTFAPKSGNVSRLVPPLPKFVTGGVFREDMPHVSRKPDGDDPTDAAS